MERESAIINTGNGHKAIVDLEDLPRLSQSRWFTDKNRNTYYAYRSVWTNGVCKKIYMHREVIGDIPDGKEVDHINGNGLDNRKENLRACSHRENCQASRKSDPNASSMYKGVTWKKDKNKWRARIMNLTGQRLELGRFESELDAAKAYDKAAMELFGEFAQLNFPKPATEADRLFPE